MLFKGRAIAYIRAHYRDLDDKTLAQGLGVAESDVSRLRGEARLTRTQVERTHGKQNVDAEPPLYTAQAPLPALHALNPADWLLAFLVGAVVLVAYVPMLGPTVTGEDSGELVTAAYTLGVAHPPGYPIWCLLGKLFTFVPYGSIAWRVAFMSAFFGALTAMIVYLLIAKLTGSSLGAAIGAFALALSAEYWEQALIAEVYTLNAFFVVACTLLLVHWYFRRHDAVLFPFAFLYGLSLCNHNTMILLGPVYVLFIVLVEPLFWKRWKLYAACTAVSLLALVVYAYLPLRSMQDPPVDWGNPETWENFRDHVTRKQYAFGFTENPRTMGRFVGQFRAFLGIYAWEFTPWACWMPFAGAWLLWRKDRLVFGMLAMIACVSSLGMILLLNFELDRQSLWLNNVFWIPCYIMAAVAIGCLAGESFRSRMLRFAVPALALACVATSFWWHHHRNDKRAYLYAYDFGLNSLDTMESDAIYFPTSDHATFPALYLQACEGMRPDIAIANKYGYPEESLYRDMDEEIRNTFRKIPTSAEETFIEDWIVRSTDRPVYFTTRREMRGLPGHELVKEGLLYRVLRPGETRSEKDFWNLYSWHDVDVKGTRGELTAGYVLSDYYFLRAWDRMVDGKAEEARQDFALALELGKDSKESLNNIGSAYAEHGMFDDAEQHLSRAVEVDPDYALARRNLGKVYLQQQIPRKALLQFEALVRLDGNDIEAVRRSAECMETIGWHAEAVERFEYLTTLTPGDAELHRSIGYLYLRELGSSFDARRHFARSLELRPEQQDLLRLLQQPPGPEDPLSPDMPGLPELPAGVPNPVPSIPNLPAVPTIPTPGTPR